ncbi:MAG: hypothetical protein HY978_03535 [Candidatus Liptonbacteria bacterium]|nr:hypothetical protein [Candidatus Liptonbacteria bacterium]
MDFPIHKTKTAGVTQRFNLNDPADRRVYFDAKCGEAIAKIRKHLSDQTFVGYLIGKKNSGKGTYSKLFMEAVGAEHIGHVAVGDIVRDIHDSLANPARKQELSDFLNKNYRGFHTVEETFDLIEGRSQEKLISSELIVALLKYEISRRPRQAVFIDGFPRGLDQISYALHLRDLIGYRNDPDFLVFISLPHAIIDERIKYRVICPICKTPRNTRLLATKEVGYDAEQKEFYLKCNATGCNGARMVPKEGDRLGIEPIRARLEVDGQIFDRLLELQGLPKVYLRNALPADRALEYVDDYEITPAYAYEINESTGQITVKEEPWVVKDDEGVPSYSLLPPAVVVSFIRQVAEVLE